jgi:AraC-like DNA-binding protein
MGQTINPKAAALSTWDPGGYPESLLARVGASPRFSDASHYLAENMLALASADRRLDSIFKDGGRYLACIWSAQLEVTGGLTLAGLKVKCANTGYISPGRARSLLTFLCYLGYAEARPTGQRGGADRYSLGEEFMAAWRAHLRLSLEAATIVDPSVGLVLDALDDPLVFRTLVRSHGEIMGEVIAATPATVRFAQAFVHRHAGSQIAHAMILAAPTDPFPSHLPFAFSQAAIARRFGVSRTHVRRLIEGAAEQGLLETGPDGTLRLLEVGRIQLAVFYAAQLLRHLIAGARTVKALPQVFGAAGA